MDHSTLRGVHPPARAKGLKPRKTNSLNMVELQLSARVTRVGNSLAILIPIAAARKAGLSQGDSVEATLTSPPVEPFGLLKDVAKGAFDRPKEKLWRDRI